MPADHNPKLAALRARIARIRRTVAALTVAAFVAVFGALYVQAGTGNDPALASAAATTTSSTSSTSGTASSTDAGTSASTQSAPVTTHQS